MAKKNLDNSNKSLVKEMMYNEMYNSEACWKGDSEIVTSNLKKIELGGKKREALKENIIIHVKGFGWKEYHITWTHKCKLQHISELAAMLRKMIKEEKNRDIPAEAYWEGHKPLKNRILGTMNDERQQLDAKCLEKMHGLRKAVKMLEFKRKARADLNSMYDDFQPFEVPTLDELVEGEMRIDNSWPVENYKDNEKAIKLEWCQGKFIGIVTRDPPTVLVVWDAMPDVDDFELEESLLLDPTKWRKRGKYGWGKDIDLEWYDNYYDENDSAVESENDDNYVAEYEDDADDVVIVHDVDIEYDSRKEEEWVNKALSDGIDCGYLC